MFMLLLVDDDVDADVDVDMFVYVVVYEVVYVYVCWGDPLLSFKVSRLGGGDQ